MRLGWICHPSLDGADGALEQARAAEDAGLSALVVSDEVLGRSAAIDLLPVLERIADATGSLTLVPVLSAPIVGRDPFAVATDLAALTRRAEGRLVVGLAVGDPAHHPEHVPNWERMSRMARVLPAMRRLLAGQEVDEDGPHVRIQGRLAAPPAAPAPVWMLADGPSSARMAAGADGLLLEASEGAARDVIEPFRAAAPAGAPVGVLAGGVSVREAVERAQGLDPWLLAVRSDGDPVAEIGRMTSLR